MQNALTSKDTPHSNFDFWFLIWASCNYETTSAAEFQMIINSHGSRFAELY